MHNWTLAFKLRNTPCNKDQRNHVKKNAEDGMGDILCGFQRATGVLPYSLSERTLFGLSEQTTLTFCDPEGNCWFGFRKTTWSSFNSSLAVWPSLKVVSTHQPVRSTSFEMETSKGTGLQTRSHSQRSQGNGAFLRSCANTDFKKYLEKLHAM